MNNQNKAFVLILFVACLSLVVLLPRNVNADEPVYDVFEFEGNSYTSMEEAEAEAHMFMMLKIKKLHEMYQNMICTYDDNDDYIAHDCDYQRTVIIEEDTYGAPVLRFRVRLNLIFKFMTGCHELE
jgi:hypothetical protein